MGCHARSRTTEARERTPMEGRASPSSSLPITTTTPISRSSRRSEMDETRRSHKKIVMKHLRKLSLFICSCLILNCVPMKAQAQEKLEDQKGTELVVDAWIGVTSMAFPEAAPFLEGGKKLLDILGAFDKPDAIQEALKRISLRLDELDARLKNVEQGLNDLQNAFLKEKNWTRFQALEQKRDSLRGYALQLKDKTEKSADFKRDLAKDVG